MQNKFVEHLGMIFMVFGLAGCIHPQPTVAQQRADMYLQSTQAVYTNFGVCMNSVMQSKAYVALQKHFAPNIQDATLEQLTDKTKPTKSDVKKLRILFPMQKKCRDDLADEMGRASPMEGAIYKKAFVELEVIALDLIEQKISWGESTRHRKELGANIDSKLMEVRQGLMGNLEKMHQEEVNQRQARAAAFGQYLQNQQIINQNQQVINSMNKPVNTNCYALGNTLNCRSY